MPRETTQAGSAAAKVAYDKAKEMGIGTEVDI